MSKARIEAYLDCNSPYSYYTIKYLRRNKDILAQHGVTVDINPIFLGGINVASDSDRDVQGNKPPFANPSKAKYSYFDGPRAARWFGIEPFTAPSFFPILSVLPMRCMLYIKRSYPEAQYLDVFEGLWESLWRQHKDISKPAVLAETLIAQRHFGENAEKEVEAILRAAASPEYKQLLSDETARIAETGAFGAPWFLVTDFSGKTEPFFGSDRFHYMWQYLGIPFTDLKLLPPGQAKM